MNRADRSIPAASGTDSPLSGAEALERRFPGLGEAARAGFAALEAGDMVGLEAVEAWIDSWGISEERSIPTSDGSAR